MLALHLHRRVVLPQCLTEDRGQVVEALKTRLCFLPLTCVSIILSCRFIPTGKHLTFLLQRRQRSWNPLVRMDYFHVLWAAPALGEGSPSPPSSRGGKRSPPTAPTLTCRSAPSSVLIACVHSPPAGPGAPRAQGLSPVRYSWTVTGIESMKISFIESEQLRLDSTDNERGRDEYRSITRGSFPRIGALKDEHRGSLPRRHLFKESYFQRSPIK